MNLRYNQYQLPALADSRVDIHTHVLEDYNYLNHLTMKERPVEIDITDKYEDSRGGLSFYACDFVFVGGGGQSGMSQSQYFKTLGHIPVEALSMHYEITSLYQTKRGKAKYFMVLENDLGFVLYMLMDKSQQECLLCEDLQAGLNYKSSIRSKSTYEKVWDTDELWDYRRNQAYFKEPVQFLNALIDWVLENGEEFLFNCDSYKVVELNSDR
jgi:hypothetical protein